MCSVVNEKAEKKNNNTKIEDQDGQHVDEAEIGRYNYLGILQLDYIFNKRMKDKMTTGYIRGVKILFKSKSNGGSLMDGLYSWNVVHYITGIDDWTKEKCLNTDRKTKKIMIMNGFMHKRYYVGRLYLPTRKGGRVLI